MELNFTEIIIAIIGIVATVVSHILTKRKYRVDTDGSYIENMGHSLDYYEKWVDSTNKRLDEVLKNQDKLMKENTALKGELNTVKQQTTRLASLLCTDLPCTKRVQDSSIIDCIYVTGSKRKAKKLNKQNHKKDGQD